MAATDEFTNTGNGTSRATIVVNVSKVGDFTPFYVTIAICSVILSLIIILNIVCCCSRYSDYWLNRHTGNRWILPLWSDTPHKQPPLDLTEFQTVEELRPIIHEHPDRRQFTASASQQRLTSQPRLTSHRYPEMSMRDTTII